MQGDGRTIPCGSCRYDCLRHRLRFNFTPPPPLQCVNFFMHRLGRQPRLTHWMPHVQFANLVLGNIGLVILAGESLKVS